MTAATMNPETQAPDQARADHPNTDADQVAALKWERPGLSITLTAGCLNLSIAATAYADSLTPGAPNDVNRSKLSPVGTEAAARFFTDHPTGIEWARLTRTEAALAERHAAARERANEASVAMRGMAGLNRAHAIAEGCADLSALDDALADQRYATADAEQIAKLLTEVRAALLKLRPVALAAQRTAVEFALNKVQQQAQAELQPRVRQVLDTLIGNDPIGLAALVYLTTASMQQQASQYLTIDSGGSEPTPTPPSPETRWTPPEWFPGAAM
jgi:hypothetical protein